MFRVVKRGQRSRALRYMVDMAMVRQVLIHDKDEVFDRRRLVYCGTGERNAVTDGSTLSI